MMKTYKYSIAPMQNTGFKPVLCLSNKISSDSNKRNQFQRTIAQIQKNLIFN